MNLRNVCAGLLAVFLILTFADGSRAAPAAQMEQPTGPATEPIDVVVVLDDSGSMATCWPWPEQGSPFEPPCRWPSANDPSDPEELRYSAARLLIHLADDADRVAVIRFDSGAEGVGALGTLQEAGGSERRRILAASLQPPDDYLRRGYTRLDLGLTAAVDLLDANRQPNRNQYVLLLTDGEPTAPASAAGQRGRISEQVARLRDAGVLVFPVVLCNPSSGCAGEFLQEQFGSDVRQAQTASDLLRVFGEIFAEMKSDRSVVTARGTEGDVTFNTRGAQGVGQIAFVSPRAAITSVQRDEAPVVTQSLLSDGNIDLNVVTGEVPAGTWAAATSDPSAFAVVQADSYPELLFPPPSALNSPASVRYYPAGTTPLIVARGAGPAAGEPLLLDGQVPIPALSNSALAAMPLPTTKGEVTIQLGDDQTPLQLRRTFRLAAREDLPRVEVFSPTPADPGLLADGRAHLEVGLGPGLSVQGVQATVQVFDITGDEELPVYQAQMNCVDRICIDEGFAPEDGRSYRMLYLLTAYAEEIRFGDWAEATLNVEPAVYLRGLPGTLDLGKMPAEGWPVSILAGTSEEIGTLDATLELRRADSGEAVPEVSLLFSAEVDEAAPVQTTLRVEGMELLRPGQYQGELQLAAISPAGRTMDVKIRPAPVLPVTLTVERSAARIQSQAADFGELPFDTSPNFRLNQQVLLPVAFEKGNPFRLTADLAESTCEGVSVTAGDLQQGDEGYLLPVRLQSGGPIAPGSCTGQIRLSGPSQDFDVFPAQLGYRLRIRNLEWSIAGELNFSDLGRAGERATQTLLVRFDGQTPFTLKMLDLEAVGEADGEFIHLDEGHLEMPPVEVRGEPNEDGFYEVPITLIARSAIPLDPLRGTFYTGDLMFSIEGLPDETRAVDLGFRSPTLYQRYVAWWLAPIYSLPWLLCTGPLSLLLLLIVVARIRNSGADADEEEPVVTLPTPDFSPTPEATFITPNFETLPRGGQDGGDSWSSQWGDVNWGGAPGGSQEAASMAMNSTAKSPANEDAWSARW